MHAATAALPEAGCNSVQSTGQVRNSSTSDACQFNCCTIKSAPPVFCLLPSVLQQSLLMSMDRRKHNRNCKISAAGTAPPPAV